MSASSRSDNLQSPPPPATVNMDLLAKDLSIASLMPAATSDSRSPNTSIQTDIDQHDTNASPPPLFLIPPHPLSTSRYNRQLLVPSVSIRGQEAISNAKVLIIGLGGLGSPASLYLATMGIGTLGLIDADTVALSNLHRQILHTEARVGQTKVSSAIEALKARNSQIRYVGYERAFVAESAAGIAEGKGENGEVFVEGGYDIILDCTDNPATRYLISDVCVVTGRVLISGAAQRAEGQLMRLCYPPPPRETIQIESPTRGPCYRCIFPNPPPPETVQSCSEIGILGPVVGMVGTLMAMDVMKILIENSDRTDPEEQKQTQKEGYTPTLLLYNALSTSPLDSFRTVRLRKTARGDCRVCGDEPVITRAAIENGGVDYAGWCGRVEDVEILKSGERVSAEAFVSIIAPTAGEVKEKQKEDKGERRDVGTKGTGEVVVVDVREPIEVQLGARIEGAVYVPISKILRPEAGMEGAGKATIRDILDTRATGDGHGEKSGTKKVYFVCQRGNDSQVAARKLIDAMEKGESEAGEQAKEDMPWIGDVIGGFEALEKISLR